MPEHITDVNSDEIWDAIAEMLGLDDPTIKSAAISMTIRLQTGEPVRVNIEAIGKKHPI